MKIGIDLDNYPNPMEEWDNLLNTYGKDREIGYLKINPERVPVIISERKATKYIEQHADQLYTFRVKDQRYEMFVESKGINMPFNGERLIFFGNAYICRKQGDANVALTMAEIEDFLAFCPEISLNPQDYSVDYIGILAFDYDAERGIYV